MLPEVIAALKEIVKNPLQVSKDPTFEPPVIARSMCINPDFTSSDAAGRA
jgi:hypothetical protein